MQPATVNAISFTLSHIPLFMLILAFIISIVVISMRGEHGGPLQNTNTLIAYLMLLAVGVSGLWGFFMHAFYPTLAASFIGWKPSPFQFEVAVANLGIGLAGVFSFRATKGFRMATTVVTTCFLWGAAAGHLKQMVTEHNFHPGNAGVIFYTDLFIPLLLIILLVMHNSRSRRVFR